MGKIMLNGEMFGVEVEANPTVPSGTTPTDLNGLKIDKDFYNIVGGGGGGGESDTLIYHLTQGNQWEDFNINDISDTFVLKYYLRHTGITGEAVIDVTTLPNYNGYAEVMLVPFANLPVNMAKDPNNNNHLYISVNGSYNTSGIDMLTVDFYKRS